MGLRRLLLLVLFLAPATAWSDGAALSEIEQAGKQIYETGRSPQATPITALVSRGAEPVPASILPCGGCHGEDGKGRPEGGVVPPAIDWNTLVAAYGHEHDYGRSHPAFDDASVALAVTQGVDPAGNNLDVAMPRYSISDDDVSALVAYLKRIQDDLDPGLTSNAIRVGTLLPMNGRLEPFGQAMLQVLEATIKDINNGGGIHGRRLELVVAEFDEDPVQSLWAVRDMLERRSVFAMVGGYTGGLTAQVAELAEELEIPMIGAFTQSPREGNGLERHSFYLTGGLEQQAAVLVRHAVGREGRVALVRPASPAFNAVAERVRRESASLNDNELLSISYQAPFLDVTDVARTLQSQNANVVMLFAPASDLKRLADAARSQGYEPDFLLPGVFAGQELFDIDAEFAGRIMIGYSSIPADHTQDGIRVFEALHDDHDIGYEFSTAQISAFVATRVLAEGLKRAGRELSREKLLLALEGLADFQPGLLPPISFNRSRRIGAFGGYVMTLNPATKRFESATNWISLQL